MTPIAISFCSRPLPDPLGPVIFGHLDHEHRREPFSVLDPRAAVRRVTRIIDELGIPVTVYRGALDLYGAEIDHLWLAASPRLPDAPFVLDVSYPLFVERFVDVLRRFVAGDANAGELDAAAAGTGVRQRVVGLFPPPLRYLGAPVWSARG